MPVNVVLDRKNELIILETQKDFSQIILRNLVGYTSEEKEDSTISYSIPPYPNNCFVLYCLFVKSPKTFNVSDEVLEGIKNVAVKNPRPTLEVMGGRHLSIKIPSVESYISLMKACGASAAMRNTWKIPFSRLYEAYRIIRNWKHPYLPSFTVSEELTGIIHAPLTTGREMSDLMNAKLEDLNSVIYGYQIKMEGFKKLKYETAGDILFKRPSRYIDRQNSVSWNSILFGETNYIKGTIVNIGASMNGRLTITLLEEISQKEVEINFFGGAYLSGVYKISDIVIIQVTKYKKNQANGGSIYNPDEVDTMPILPVYRQSATNKITTKVLTQCVEEIFTRFKNGHNLAPYIKSTKKNLWSLLLDLHFPKNVQEYQETVDQLAYIELLYLQLLFLEEKNNEVLSKGLAKSPKGKTDYLNEALNSLPFSLTKDQTNAINEFKSRMRTPKPEKMLLSADVGAGKTLCAQMACLYAVDSGTQAILVAPTEILAQQLFSTFEKLVVPLKNKPNIVYLSGKTKAKERKKIVESIECGETDIIVGTHAVATLNNVPNLGLVVIDEQQKFGAETRNKFLHLRNDDILPDEISQTATPIPQTTALAFYGEIDLVTIKEKPANRKPIITKLINNSNSEEFLKEGPNDIWEQILYELSKGHQMYIVAPAVEEDSKIISVNKIEKMLSRYKNEMKIKTLSGKDSKEKQNKTLTSFKNNEFNVLIASSIVEVGIDVPNSTVVIVVGADRFGASSLHQIRGRVGRSDLQSYCYLVPDTAFSLQDLKKASTKERLLSLVNSNDGFEIALADLSTRKEGDVLGTKQSGSSTLMFCDLSDHTHLIDIARAEAKHIYKSKDKDLAIKDALSFLKQDREDE